MKRLSALAVSFVASLVLCCLAFSFRMMQQQRQWSFGVYAFAALIVIAIASAFVSGTIVSQDYQLPQGLGKALSYRPKPLIIVFAVLLAVLNVVFAYGLMWESVARELNSTVNAFLAAISGIAFSAALICAGRKREAVMRICLLIMVAWFCQDLITYYSVNSANPDKGSYAWVLAGQGISALAFLSVLSLSATRQFTTLRMLWVYLRLAAVLTAIALATDLFRNSELTATAEMMIIRICMLLLTERIIICNLTERAGILETEPTRYADLAVDIPLPKQPEYTVAEVEEAEKAPESSVTMSVDDILKEIENDFS